MIKLFLKKQTEEFTKTLRDKFFVQYVIKCLLGSAICYLLYKLFPKHQFQWSIISVLLVLAPDHKDSIRLSLDRIRANVIGAFVGLMAFFIHAPNLVMVSGSVLVTILFCTFIKLGNASRSALAALIIVLVQEKEYSTAVSAIERMLCVFTGCITALLLTYMFSFFNRYKNKHE